MKREMVTNGSKTKEPKRKSSKRIKAEGTSTRDIDWTDAEDEVLIESVRSQRYILDAQLNGITVTVATKRKIFEDISKKVSSIGHCFRTWEKCREHYKNLKNRYARNIRQINHPRTGGGRLVERPRFMLLFDQFMSADCSVVGVNDVEMGDGKPLTSAVLSSQLDETSNESEIVDENVYHDVDDLENISPRLSIPDSEFNGVTHLHTISHDLSIREFDVNALPADAVSEAVGSTATASDTSTAVLAEDPPTKMDKKTKKATGARQSMLDTYTEKSIIAMENRELEKQALRLRVENEKKRGKVIDMELEQFTVRNAYWKLMYDMKMEKQKGQKVAFITSVDNSYYDIAGQEVVITSNNDILGVAERS